MTMYKKKKQTQHNNA